MIAKRDQKKSHRRRFGFCHAKNGVRRRTGIVIPANTYQIDPNWAGANGGITPGGPGGSGIRPVLFDGESTYHGLQAQLKKTMSHGLQGQLSYTWGKCRDTSSAPLYAPSALAHLPDERSCETASAASMSLMNSARCP